MNIRRRALTATLLVGLLGVAACNNPPSPERAFVMMMRASSSDEDNLSDEEILEAGKLICEHFAQGESWAQIEAGIVAFGGKPLAVYTLVSNATTYLCLTYMSVK